MIYTLTLNPSIDYIMTVSDFKTGQINRADTENIFVGGKGINVSAMLKTLGIESVALGFVAGDTGKMIQRQLEREKIKTEFITVAGMSRINVKLCGGVETEINGRGPVVDELAMKELFVQLDDLKNGDILVISGSLANGMPDSAYAEISRFISKKRGVRLVIDTSGDALLNSLQYKPFLVKPNHIELGEIFGVDIKEKENAILYAEKLAGMGAENVLVSMGEQGAVFVTNNGKKLFSDAVKGNVISTVGAGDSMVAGFLAGFIMKKDLEFALKMGTCVGSATAFSTGLAKKSDIDKIIKEN